MKKKIIFLLAFPIAILAFTDLGRWGEQYQIVERIHWKDINKSIITKKKMYKAIANATFSKEKLPHCKKTTTRLWDPSVTLKHSIVMPKYNIDIKKGTKFNPLDHANMKRYYVLIDGSDNNQTQLAEYYKNISDIIIYNGSINAIRYTPTSHIYIANKLFTKSFKPRCLPSIYIQKKDKYLIKEINVKDLLKKGKK